MPVQETQETHVPSLGWEDALKQETAIYSNIPAWKIPEQRSLPMGSQRISHDRAHTWNNWSNRQIWPWSTDWSTAKVNTVCQENALVIANKVFQRHKRWVCTWTSPDGQYWDQMDYILCSWKWRSAIQSAKTRLGADYGSDHELLIAKFRLKLKRVGEITRQFRYDLNQIPYDYTVEVKNRFKELDLIDRMPEELWMEVHDIVQEIGIKTIPKKKKCKKAKWLSEEALQIAEKRREAKGKEKRKDTPIWMQSSKE